MKKLSMTLLTILASGAIYALPVGNPSDASLLCDGLLWEGHCGDPCDPCLSWCDAFSARIGFYGDYVFNRHLEDNTNELHKNLEHTKIFTNAAFLAANFWDRFDVFTTLGATNIFIDTNATAFENTTNGARFELETETRFSWSLGVRGTLWECGCTSLGAEAQYFFTRPDITRLTIGSLSSIYPDDVDAKYWEWQIGLGISHRINIFVPYVAVKWSRAKLKFDNATFTFNSIDGLVFGDTTLVDLENRKDWGYAVGVSLVDCEKASLTVEGRFSDEKALYVNGQIRF
jgi:major outer membrane protein